MNRENDLASYILRGAFLAAAVTFYFLGVKFALEGDWASGLFGALCFFGLWNLGLAPIWSAPDA